MSSDHSLIGPDDVRAAEQIISGRVHRTPITSSTYLSELAKIRLFFKLEMFQKTGSFKVRGVLNKLHHLSPADKQKGVITLSAGNHAQALAWGARQEGIRATVVMPAHAVRSKVEATRGYGAEVVQTDGDLLATCLAIQKERGLTLVHPFDDLLIIAGHGTLGAEILDDLPQVDVVVVGVGGGGLISGISAYLNAQKPAIKVFGVEPEGATGMSQSLQRGEPVHLDRVNTVADGLAAPFAGEHTLAHVKAFVDKVVIVSDKEIIDAMALILERCKVVAEPAAASTLAAVLSGKLDLRSGATVLCVLSGGNIDRERLKTIL